ncbi:Mbov_0121 family peptidase domain-containing ABC transporter [Mesomycoplasma conjunctivae]|uniref:Mbov_0121 family peptidase domain-containing ABC transporter n=1 Tax=Mesomycoplasma conjunctivae TaxID=45361 RepID=UPI003DA3D4C4
MKTFKQKDLKDCGLAVLQSIFHHFYHKNLSINKLKDKAYYSHDGINIVNLERLAKDFGIILDSYGGDFPTLQNLEFNNRPIIILIKNNQLSHYVLLLRITKKYFYIMDPLIGKRKISVTDMQKLFANVVIFANKDSNFPKNSTKKNWYNIWFFLESKTNWYLLFLIFLIALSNFISSLFLKTIVDKVLPEQNISLLAQTTIFFLWIILWRIIQEVFKKIYTHKIELKIEKDIFDRFFSSLQKGKNYQLLKLDNHDYLRRISLIPSFASFSANFYYHLFNELVSFAISFVILLWIDWKMFLLILIISLVYTLVNLITKKSISKKYHFLIDDQLKNMTATNDMIFSLVDLKNEDIFHNLKKRFDDNYYKFKNSEYNIWKQQSFLQTFGNLVFSISPIIIVFVSAFWIFDRQVQIGQLLLFLSFFNFFINPLSSFVDIVTNLPIFLKEVELLNFILNVDKEKYGNYHQKISDLKFNNLNINYDGGRRLIYIKKLLINSHLKIIGKNGSGKSTLLKLINHEINFSGQFLINNLDISHYDIALLRKNIAFIKNDQYFPAISVISFICNDKNEKMETFFQNIQIFDLQTLFEKWELDLNAHFYNNGANFSSGQKQIILLLKLLTQKFDLILLDEAFENIDENNFAILKKVITTYQADAIFIEISHSQRYLQNQGEKLNIETLSK